MQEKKHDGNALVLFVYLCLDVRALSFTKAVLRNFIRFRCKIFVLFLTYCTFKLLVIGCSVEVSRRWKVMCATRENCLHVSA